MATFLQLFLIVDVFVAGAAIALAIEHAYIHFKHPADQHADSSNAKEALPDAVRQQLLKESQEHFKVALNASVDQLEKDLTTTAGLLDKLVKRLGAEIVGDELERYRVELTTLRKQAQTALSTVKTEVDAHRAELEQQTAQALAAEKQRLVQQIDTKLADAVGSFLTETLQHGVDLGAQETYLKQMLEEHKADFLKEVADEPRTAK